MQTFSNGNQKVCGYQNDANFRDHYSNKKTRLQGDSPSRALGRVNTVIYEANDTKNVSLTHEKYRYDTTVNRRYKTIFFWRYNTHGMPQF